MVEPNRYRPRPKALRYPDDMILASGELLISRMRVACGGKGPPTDPTSSRGYEDTDPRVELPASVWERIKEPVCLLANLAMIRVNDQQRPYFVHPGTAVISFTTRRRANAK